MVMQFFLYLNNDSDFRPETLIIVLYPDDL